MITEEQIELLTERLINRIQKANMYFLKNIGATIKKIKSLKPTEAQQLIQILKYGTSYDDIVRQIRKYTNLNVEDIDNIFSSYAKKDQQFYKQFYEYRNIPFVPYEQNAALQAQTMALANIVKNELYDFTRANVLGYTITDETGKVLFKGLKETYNELLDTALVNVGTGKETFDNAMRKILKDIGESGLKTINYQSGRSIRLDSAVRTHLLSGLRELHNENQRITGEEFGTDGYEISVHANPAIDHEKAQGRQFSIKEYEKLNAGLEAKDYTGKTITLDHDGKNGYRPISELNCYHYIFSIVLGVNKPEYNEQQLQEIINNNNKGFDFDGKHYTMYDGEQLQRRIERKIREQKDVQILAKESGNGLLVGESQQKITQLTNKYKELSNVSGLKTKMERMKVSTYRRTNIKRNNWKEIEYARKNNVIWHSTENLGEIIGKDKLISPSLSVGKTLNTKVKYGTQFIEFKPEILEKVNKDTKLYKGDGGNQYTKKAKQFNNLMAMLKNDPKYYNELKFNRDLKVLQYIKKVYIRNDESQRIINILNENNIKYEIYYDKRFRT